MTMHVIHMVLQANRSAARSIELSLRGTGVSAEQLVGAMQGVAPFFEANPTQLRALAQLVGAGGLLEQALARPDATAIARAGDEVLRAAQAVRPLLDTIVAARAQPQDDNTGSAAFERVFQRLLASAQDPANTRRPDHTNGPLQVKVAMMDSGTGGLQAGLTIEREFDRNGDGNVTFAYVTDHGAESYGNRSPQEIARLTNNTLRYAQDVLKADVIIMACNTATASFPDGGNHGINIPVVNLIENTAELMADRRQAGAHPAMFATAATVDSQTYQRLLGEQGLPLAAVPCPEWADYVNKNWHTDPAHVKEVADNVAERVAQLPRNTTAVFLNCTHYPAMEDMITSAISRRWRQEFPNDTRPRVIDPMRAQAQAALDEVRAVRDRGNGGDRLPGARTVVTTGNPGLVGDQVYTRFYDPHVVFGLNPTFRVGDAADDSPAYPRPDAGLPQALQDALSNGSIGFAPGFPNLGRLPADVLRGFDLNYRPSGTVDNRFLRLREEARQIINTLPQDAREPAREAVDREFAQRRVELAGMPTLTLPADLPAGHARAVAQALQRFANERITATSATRLPPTITPAAVESAAITELRSAGVSESQARELVQHIASELGNWCTDMNVQRNDQAHRLTEALSRILLNFGAAR
jgi:glutamate racemase